MMCREHKPRSPTLTVRIDSAWQAKARQGKAVYVAPAVPRLEEPRRDPECTLGMWCMMRYEGSNESRNWQEEGAAAEGRPFSMWVHSFKFASSYHRVYADGSKTINIVITVTVLYGWCCGSAEQTPLHYDRSESACGDLTVGII